MSGWNVGAASIAEARADFYAFLAGQWLEPPGSGGSVTDLVGRWRAAAAAMEGCGAEEVLELLGSEVDAAAILQGEFQALLRIPTERYVAPIRSVYRAAVARGGGWTPGRLRTRPWFEARQAYRRAGWTVLDEDLELDHVGCMLRFAGALCRAEAAAWAGGELLRAREVCSEHLRFVETQLLDWVPSLRSRVERVSRVAYYPSVARMTTAYLDVERTYLGRSGR